MKHYILITIVALSISMSSCSQHSDHAQSPIVLNNGEKWSVHDNMMLHIQKMVDDVERTAAQKDQDFESLNKDLLSGIDALTSDCTMKGQAHDELHKWLLPFIATANEFNSDMTKDQRMSWFSNVQSSLEEFKTYFQD